MASIDNARKTIDEVDKQIAELFVKRMNAAKEVAQYKQERGLQIFDSVREQAILARNTNYIEEEGLKTYYAQFLQSMMDISKSYQRRLIAGTRVAYAGIPGAFANIAVRRIFPECEAVPFASFKAAYESVVDGTCDVAVLPIENSSAGEVGQVIDLMFSGGLYVNGVYSLPVIQNLLGVEGSTADDIKTVISHPQALEQCAKYINENGFEVIQSSNTAIAAREVAEKGDKSVAAIASTETAELYGLKVIDRQINEGRENTTRFAVFSTAQEKPVKTEFGTSILMFTVLDEAGSLAKAIKALGDHGYNMRVLRSRPLKDLSWHYYFYAEAEGHISDENSKELIDALAENCKHFKIVGTFGPDVQL